MDKYTRLVEIACALYDKNRFGRTKHFSFIMDKSKILSIGLNDYTKTHPQIQRFNYHPFAKLHSELHACLKLGMVNCSGLIMINIRINGNGELDNSKFCPGCTDLISALGFKSAYFTNKHGNFEKF